MKRTARVAVLALALPACGRVTADASGAGSGDARSDATPDHADSGPIDAGLDGDGGAAGAAPDQAATLWRPIAQVPDRTLRVATATAWTGTEWLVVGGVTAGGIGGPMEPFPAGLAYDPAGDSWRDLAPYPEGVQPGLEGTFMQPPAAWTGAHLYTGYGFARYSPSSDWWEPISKPAFGGSHSSTFTWTGSELLEWWGSALGDEAGTGVFYDPSTITWRAAPSFSAPDARTYHQAVLAGGAVVIWGGVGIVGGDKGPFALDLATEAWRALPTEGAPVFSYTRAFWTGSELLVWGLDTGNEHGALYSFARDTWRPMSRLTDVVDARDGEVVAWTGDALVVYEYDDLGGVGGLYDPATDRWIPLDMRGGPKTYLATAAWISAGLIVWHGEGGSAIYPAAAIESQR